MGSSQRPPGSFRRIVAATDGSDNATRAVRVAIALAQRYSAELLVVNAISFPVGVGSLSGPEVGDPRALERYSQLARSEARAILAAATALAKEAGVSVRSVLLDRASSPVEMITRLAEQERADLIVSGTRGLSGFKKMILGSVSAGLVSRAPCSVLIVR